MDKVIAEACPSCQGRLYLDEGSPDTREEPGTPRMVYCEDCGDFPEVLGRLDKRERLCSGIVKNIDETLASLGAPDAAPKGSADFRRGRLVGARSALEAVATPFREKLR